jgi:hypothetical protein
MTDTPMGEATKFDRTKLKNWDIRRFVTDDVIETINKRHSHEGDGNKPIWIIWSLRADCAPQIDTLCDTADSAVYHYGMIMQEIEAGVQQGRQMSKHLAAAVERVPANHRFASSIAYLFDGPIAYGQPRKRRT